VKLLVAVLTLAIAANASAQDALLPNPRLTPGKIAGRDKDRSGVTTQMEQKVFARYRLPWSRRPEFKIDHLVPVELGGADTVDNLWPQSLRIKPYGADRKELLTELLLQRIRTGRMTMVQAQDEIRKDWIDAFVEYFGMVYLK
jgi:hypothetical protein